MVPWQYASTTVGLPAVQSEDPRLGHCYTGGRHVRRHWTAFRLDGEYPAGHCYGQGSGQALQAGQAVSEHHGL